MLDYFVISDDKTLNGAVEETLDVSKLTTALEVAIASSTTEKYSDYVVTDVSKDVKFMDLHVVKVSQKVAEIRITKMEESIQSIWRKKKTGKDPVDVKYWTVKVHVIILNVTLTVVVLGPQY